MPVTCHDSLFIYELTLTLDSLELVVSCMHLDNCCVTTHLLSYSKMYHSFMIVNDLFIFITCLDRNLEFIVIKLVSGLPKQVMIDINKYFGFFEFTMPIPSGKIRLMAFEDAKCLCVGHLYYYIIFDYALRQRFIIYSSEICVLQTMSGLVQGCVTIETTY